MTGCSTASGNGGGISKSEIYGCEVTGCSAKFGGAIDQCYVVRDSVITNNAATHSGGGTYLATVTRSKIAKNTAKSWAGGAFDTTLTDCEVEDNAAGDEGGGLLLDNGKIVISGTHFCGNSSGGNGGAIGLRSDTVEKGKNALISNCTFVANLSNASGGAFDRMQNVTHCFFADNSNKYFSAGCWRSKIRDSVMTGGGEYAQCELLRCCFTNCTANYSQKTLILACSNGAGSSFKSITRNCLFADCSAQYLLQNQGSTNVFENNTVLNCTVAQCPILLTKYEATEPTSVAATCELRNNIFDYRSVAGYSNLLTVWSSATTIVARNNLAVGLNLPSASSKLTIESADNRELTLAAMRLCETDNRWGVPRGTPKNLSPAKDAGLTLDWMADATDLAGNPRVVGTAPDIGAYESTIPRVGLYLFVW